jgi:transposase
MLLEGTVNTAVFNSWLAQMLLPELTEASVIIMDNAAFHKHPSTRKLIQAAGHTLLYLPPYSPDLNPIEMMWSKVKAPLRAAEARSHEALLQAIAHALAAVTPDDAKNWFAHCGYSLV